MVILTGKEFNKKYQNTKFFKIINEKLEHNKFKFVDGLNEDTVQFNPCGVCNPRGIYFSEESKIHMYYDYGIYIVKVKIPDDAQVYEEPHKFKADKIILDLKNKSNVKWYNYNFCLESVKQNGLNLVYVKNQTPEICLAAVKQNGMALQYIKEKTPKKYMASVKQYGWVLQYVNEQTLEIYMAAVQQNENAKQFIKIEI